MAINHILSLMRCKYDLTVDETKHGLVDYIDKDEEVVHPFHVARSYLLIQIDRWLLHWPALVESRIQLNPLSANHDCSRR